MTEQSDCDGFDATELLHARVRLIERFSILVLCGRNHVMQETGNVARLPMRFRIHADPICANSVVTTNRSRNLTAAVMKLG